MENVRVQDAVARLAGIDLKSTVRVLRALSIVANYIDERKLSDTLERLYAESTNNGGKIMPLQAKPCKKASEASDTLNKIILKKVGLKHVESLRSLEGCPYAEAEQINGSMP